MKPCINLFNSYHQGALHPKARSQAAPVAAAMSYPLAWPPYSFPLGVVVIVLFVAALSFYQIDGFSGEYDEGAHVMVAWLMSRGFSLYTEIASAQLPLLYQPTAWVFALFGPSLVLARWVEIGYALLGIVVVAGLGRRLWRPAVGLWAALFLSLEYYWFYNSRMAVGSVAAAATGGLAVWCALNYYRRGDRRWLARAGLIYSFSLLIKPLALFVGLLFPVLILARWRRGAPAVTGNGLWLPLVPWPSPALDCLYLGIGVLLLPALSLVFYDGPEMVNRLVNCRLEAKVFSPRSNDYLVTLLTTYLRRNLALGLLAVMGTLKIIRRRNAAGLFIISWLGLSLLLLLVETGHRHHLVILDLPLVLLAAYPLGELNRGVTMRGWRWSQWGHILATVCLGYWLSQQISAWPGHLATGPNGVDKHPERWTAVRLLQQVTTPEQFVVSDDLAIPFVAGRLVVPQLADPSSGSSGCDRATENMFLEYTNRRGAAVIFWTGRLAKRQILPRWVQTAYAGREQIEEERIIYYDKRPPWIPHPLKVQFDGTIALEGYKVDAGAPSRLTLFWRKLKTNYADDYKMTLRVLNNRGQLVGQVDRQPFYGFYPTSSWPVGVLLPETIELSEINAGLTNKYMILLGLYQPDTQELLPVDHNSRSDNLIPLDFLTPQ